MSEGQTMGNIQEQVVYNVSTSDVREKRRKSNKKVTFWFVSGQLTSHPIKYSNSQMNKIGEEPSQVADKEGQEDVPDGAEVRVGVHHRATDRVTEDPGGVEQEAAVMSQSG